MTKLETWILLANFHLDIQANSYTTAFDWVASPCAREKVRVSVRVRVMIY